jgi:uncharacterized protein (DUF924 family)
MRDLQKDILDFWFIETAPSQYFQTSEDFDHLIHQRFGHSYEWAKDGLYDSWMRTEDGCLTLCILLDQFPRNMFRGKAQAYDTDLKARFVAHHALKRGYDQLFIPLKRRFLYLPFEHSEVMDDQKLSVSLFESMKEDDPTGYDYALRHYKVIETFGRFPHRNVILGRQSTADEEQYLLTPGAGF